MRYSFTLSRVGGVFLGLTLSTQLALAQDQPTNRSLDEVRVLGLKSKNGLGNLGEVGGAVIYAGKKTEVLVLDSLDANTAQNNPRQILGRIPSMNFSETEGAGFPSNGLVLRGLNPVQSVEMNVRQNGYNITAAIYGYSETYYTPALEAVERIEVVRGAASLQFGPQFGGVINYVMRQGPTDKPLEFTMRQTGGSFGLADGTSYSLRQPTYAMSTPYQALPAGVLLSPRVAPPVFGLGLLEAVSDADILANADENDANGDGISGRPNYVWDVASQTTLLGRFGWKANQPTLRQQVGAAYNGDMGITTSLFPLEPAAGQSQAGNQPPSTGTTDLNDTEFDNVTYYVRTLAVPARRNTKDAQVLAGKALFVSAKCASCHLPRLRTSGATGLPTETANQTIAPYTDLLLHDMGPALADQGPDFKATGQEWRTPPLWGLGLTQVVNGHNSFLHDGRARGMLEAIMWHGGEAQQSATAVSNMSATDRTALLAFLQSL